MRPNNEDALIEAPEIGLFGVCDGLGGHAGGEVASSLASQAFPDLLRNTDLPVAQALKRSLTASNDRILEFQTLEPKLQGMGTTLSAVWIRPRGEEAIWVVHIGDSRIYRIREGQILQVTDDHSPVYRLYKAGRLSQEEARRHPHRNIVERSLGIRHQIQPDIFPIDFRPFDRILICSDGLTDQMTDEEIGGVAGGKDLCPAARELVAEANRRGGHDNITLVLIEISAFPSGT